MLRGGSGVILCLTPVKRISFETVFLVTLAAFGGVNMAAGSESESTSNAAGDAAGVKFSAPESLSENVGQASSLPVYGASSPRDLGGRMPPELADKMSAPHFQAGS